MTIEERNKAVEENMPIVHYICRHVFPSCVGQNYDDFVQAGMVELIMAADRFEDRGTASFATYAYSCVKGAIARQVIYAAKAGQNLPTVSMNSVLDEDEELQLEGTLANYKDEISEGDLDMVTFIDSLPPHLKRTCEYRILGYSYKEIAKKEKVTHQAIVQRIASIWKLYQLYKAERD